MSFRLAKPRRNSSLSISTSSSSLGGEERSDGPDRKQPYAKRENTDGRTPKRRTDPLKTILEEHKGQGESVEADGKVWGMPRWGDVVTDEVEPGIKVVSLSQASRLHFFPRILLLLSSRKLIPVFRFPDYIGERITASLSRSRHSNRSTLSLASWNRRRTARRRRAVGTLFRASRCNIFQKNVTVQY
jgi:hypothetical protein